MSAFICYLEVGVIVQVVQSKRSTPKYQIVYNYYSEQIKSGQLQSGEKLPTEAQICKLFCVSRVTVRKALDDLQNQGYIVKEHSKGSFVSQDVSGMSLDRFQGFTEEMAERGMTASTEILHLSVEKAGKLAARKLNVDERSKVYVIERLRLVESEPMAIEKVILPCFYCPNLYKFDLTKSLYSLLEKEYGLRFSGANEVLEAACANKREAEILNIKSKAPVLKIERLSYLSDNTVLEYTLSVYRGDRYKFYVTMNK